LGNIKALNQSAHHQGRSEWGMGGCPSQIECYLALLRTNNEQVSDFRLNFS